MVNKQGRFGPFLGCSDYPKCKTILNIDADGNVMPPKPPPEPTGVKCYKCKNGKLVIRSGKKGPFLACDKFPKCRTIVSNKKLEQLKLMQAEGTWPPETIEQAKQILGQKTGKKKRLKKGAG